MTPTHALDRRQFLLCCLTVLAALLPHATWLPTPLLAVLLALIVARWLQRTWWPRPWPWWFRNGLMLALFAGAWISIGTISGTQGAGFLAAMMVSKLYEAERIRDARSVATFASFLVMAQFLFQSELWAMFAALPGTVLAVATLASLQQTRGSGPAAPLRALRTASALLLVALPFALVLFVVFPRLVSPLWGNAFATQRGEMGLGDRMEPGQLGSLGLDDRPALRVRFEGEVPPSPLRYFRGLTLWSTDGRAWTRPEWTDTPLRDLPPVPDRGVRHEITLEPDAAPWLPVLDRPIAAPVGLQLAIDHSLPLPRRNRERRYAAVSDPSLALEPFGLSAQTRSIALALPEGRNPRTVALARQLRAASDSDEDFARRALALFRDEYRYTLEPPPLGANAVDEFLFDTLTGYCEHYASAYATLLRAGGVPARVVLGYQGGYYNAIGGHLVVRRADAHAWVESWIEGRGWLRADPTSMVAPDRIDSGGNALLDGLAGGLQRGGAWRWLYDRWDYLELRWTDWVVNYRAADQAVLLQRLLTMLPSSMRSLMTVLGVVAAIGALVMLWLLRGRAAPVRASDPLARWYARFRAVLAGGGVPSSAAESAPTLVARAATLHPRLAPLLDTLASRYQAARYGTGAPRGPGMRELAQLWLKLRHSRVRRLLRLDRQHSAPVKPDWRTT
jgi:transglutaminase-like putative cysteine protease